MDLSGDLSLRRSGTGKMFQLAHSPECNPIEQVWQYLKKRWRWHCLKT